MIGRVGSQASERQTEQSDGLNPLDLRLGRSRKSRSLRRAGRVMPPKPTRPARSHLWSRAGRQGCPSRISDWRCARSVLLKWKGGLTMSLQSLALCTIPPIEICGKASSWGKLQDLNQYQDQWSQTKCPDTDGRILPYICRKYKTIAQAPGIKSEGSHVSSQNSWRKFRL